MSVGALAVRFVQLFLYKKRHLPVYRLRHHLLLTENTVAVANFFLIVIRKINHLYRSYVHVIRQGYTLFCDIGFLRINRQSLCISIECLSDVVAQGICP